MVIPNDEHMFQALETTIQIKKDGFSGFGCRMGYCGVFGAPSG
jgi:hypothetical protein